MQKTWITTSLAATFLLLVTPRAFAHATLPPLDEIVQATPESSPVPAAPAAASPEATPFNPAPFIKHSNPNFNPCGGWRELLIGYPGPTPCVYQWGEGEVGAAYTGSFVPLNTQLELNGTTVASTNVSHSETYMAFPVFIGLPGRWQFMYSPPAYQELIGFNHNIDRTGTTNQSFSLKNLWFFNHCFPVCGGDTLSALILTYTPPTGSPAWRGTGPSYGAALSTTVTVGKSPRGLARFLVNLYLPFTNSVISSTPGSVTRGWSGATSLTGIWIHHSFRVNLSTVYTYPAHQVAFALSPNYLISRRLVVGANIGGAPAVYVANSIAVPSLGILAVTNQTHPQFWNIGIYYLWGRTSEPLNNMGLPPQQPQD